MTTRNALLIFGAALVLPLTASAQDIEVQLEPGFYDITEETTLLGFSQGANNSQYCIEAGKNRWGLQGLFAQNNLDGKCTLSNVQMTSSSGSADTSCHIEEIGLTVTAKIEANYTPSSFDGVMTTNIPNMPASVTKVSANRSGECPAGWVNPEFRNKEE